MKLIKNLEELKLGQSIAWKSISDNVWLYITKVKGFHKKTTYPNKINGIVYQTQNFIDYDIVTISNNNNIYTMGYEMLLGRVRMFQHGKELITTTHYNDKMFEAWLLEDESDHLFILKHMLADSL
jgi:hypothetical protein